MMVFRMIPAASTGPLVRLHGKINATIYKEILKKHVALNSRTATSCIYARKRFVSLSEVC